MSAGGRLTFVGPSGCRVSGGEGCGGSVNHVRGVSCSRRGSSCVYGGKGRLSFARLQHSGSGAKCIDMGAVCRYGRYGSYPCGGRYVGKGGYGAPVRRQGGILSITGAFLGCQRRSLRQVLSSRKVLLEVGEDVRTRKSFNRLGRSVRFHECLDHNASGILIRDVLLTVTGGMGGLRGGVRGKGVKERLFPLGDTWV